VLVIRLACCAAGLVVDMRHTRGHAANEGNGSERQRGCCEMLKEWSEFLQAHLVFICGRSMYG
jgi:hypothetical protein